MRVSARNMEKERVARVQHLKEQKRRLFHQTRAMPPCSVVVKWLSLYQTLKVFKILAFSMANIWFASAFQWDGISSIADDWEMEGEVQKSGNIQISTKKKVRFYCICFPDYICFVLVNRSSMML